MEKQENLRNYLQSLPNIQNRPDFEINPSGPSDIGETMLLPIRCYTCNKIIAQDENVIMNSILHGFKIQYILDALGYDRYCCRRTIFTSRIVTLTIKYYEEIWQQYINMASQE